MKSRRTIALAIPMKVKEAVFIRDGGSCIFCGRPGLPNAHYISRSHGGLGIKENIVTLCPECHRLMDQTINREPMLEKTRKYLDLYYPNFSNEDREYNKFREEKNDVALEF